MSEPQSIAAYNAALERALGRPDGPRARRALREVADHLEDAADALQVDGMPRDEAERQACARFGATEQTARRLVAGGALAGEIPVWVALPLWSGLALSLAAGGLFAFMATVHSGPAVGAMELAILAATLILALGFARLQFSSTAAGRAGLVTIGALSASLLIAGLTLGVAAIVAGTGSGDMEYYLVLRAWLIAGTGFVGVAAQFLSLRRFAGPG